MRFRRPSVKYSATPEPVTPYQKAAQVWDERLGSARVQARNWRMMAFGCLLLSIGLAGAYVWRATQSLVTPFVIEVEHLGKVRAVGKAATPYQPTDAQTAYHLARFIGNVRTISLDPLVVRQNWLDAYDYTTDRGAAFLNDYARANDPFTKIGKQTVTVEVSSIVRASDRSFQAQWTERRYVNGSLAETEQWTAILTVALQPPNTEAKLRTNPLGIYVDGINWSRQLSGGNRP
ncbi:conjugal transfer protein TrbF [Pusillimonas noertemannii]|uniref:Type IV secretion system protein VirB5 n=1 Tax=Pusillimonas noertemannii TaxID=305977 RepID=A0A2U1CM87_9BURK|nr:conjugal transfer protein TrbF [Pusillimonas noertemannii]NYT68878.1 conjugal transfer protein TrbF [Pusillimonas noertemannii]PVY62101.1 type IV secretion system protein VirB5 [Pusillimonas noertemannii]TFL10904.1 conjugal transfer protein TrbF [Pusillimonas noertemannii]